MRRLTYLTATATIALLMITSGADAAFEDGIDQGQPTPSAGIRDGVPEVIVAVDAAGTTIARGRPGGRGRWSCHYFQIHSIDPSALPGSADYDTGPIRPDDGQIVMLECRDESNRLVRSELIEWTPAAPFGPIDAAQRAAQLAREQLDVPDPTPATSPPVGSEHLTGLATWFWTTTTQQVTASATLAGVTATVTATPTTLHVDPGDGTDAFTCANGGTPYDTTKPANAQHSACTHVFQYRSWRAPTGAWPTMLRVTWQLTWEATTGEAGDLGTIDTTALVPSTVIDAQAVIL